MNNDKNIINYGFGPNREYTAMVIYLKK